MSSNISFTGLASGLNTTALVQNLLRFDQQRIATLNQTVSTDTNKQTVFQGVTSRLQTLETAASQLAIPQGSVFDNTTVTSSNSNLVTAATGSGAQPGITSLKVLSLAQANQIASQGFEDPNSVISQGTFQIQAGSQSATLSIDSTNNTLSGLATAINNAGIGVSATIVNTGSTDTRTQPYRLLLTSSKAGTANAIKITNNLAPDGSGAIQPNFSTTEIGPAVTDANFTGTSAVASNSGAGTYTGSSNDAFTFQVVSGGTVGTDNGIQLSYANSSGTQTGTITLNQADGNTAKDVVDGLQVNFGAGTLNTGDQFTVNVFSPTIQSATDAQVQLGSGAGAVVIRNSTNTLTNLIPGVTIQLQSADPTQTVQLNVANDVAGATTAITNFVNDYNDFASYLKTQTAYTQGTGTSSGTAAPLNGISAITGLRSQVEEAMTAISPDLPTTISQLGVLGITPDSNGQLQIDKTQLQNALSGNVPGISYNDLKSLFGLQGQSNSAGVQFATGTSSTKSSATPFTVHVTQAAQRASLTGTNAVAGSTVIDATNDTLQMTIDGQNSGTITLARGTYTPQALANELQTEINGAMSSKGSAVSVSSSNGNLLMTSTRYGSQSTISFASGTALSALGFTGSESSTGTDVAGSFVVNGVTETATGTGQILQGSSTNTNTAGLSVVVSLTPAQVLAGGTDSSMTVTRGVAANLDNLLKAMLDPVNGETTLLNKQLTTLIQNAQTDVNKQTAAMNAQQAALMSQFAAMETVMQNLQSTSNMLTSLLASASSSTSSSSSSSSSGLGSVSTGSSGN